MISIPNPLLSSTFARPDGIALEFEGTVWSWQEMLHHSRHAAAWLADQGIKPGSVVALTGHVCSEWVAFFHGASWLGAVILPVDPSLNADRVQSIFDQVNVDLNCCPENIELALNRMESELPEERDWPLEESRLIIMTSGTTAQSKPVYLTTAQLVFSAFGSAIRLGHQPGDRWLNCLPLHHVGGISILIRTALYGTAMRLMNAFVPQTIAAALDSGEINQVSLVPAMWKHVLDARATMAFPPALRTILIGGAKLPDALRERGAAIGAPVAETWGMTEAASQVCTRTPEMSSHGVGVPMPFARVNESEGRLHVSGPIAGHGFISSDAGYVSESGQVHVSGRIDDVIISGGINLMPTLIESVLLTHPKIKDVVVVAQTDPRWGERPHALLVPSHQDDVPQPELLHRWCGERLKNYEIPDGWHWIESIPTDAMGKVSRKALASSLGIRRRQETEPVEAINEGLGTIQGSEVIQTDERVLELDAASEIIDASISNDVITEGHRSSTEALDPRSDEQSIGLPNRSTKIGFGVDDGRTKAPLVEKCPKSAKGGDEELLVTRVRVLEDAPKEDNTSPVNFVETRGDGDFECHERALLSQRTHKR